MRDRIKKVWSRAKACGITVSDWVSRSVGTWTFVIVYTGVMMVWIMAHVLGVLHIDNSDFMKWNLFLSWFAGTQASIVLMSSDRQSERDRRRMERISRQVDMLDDVLEDFIDEQEDPIDEGKNG